MTAYFSNDKDNSGIFGSPTEYQITFCGLNGEAHNPQSNDAECNLEVNMTIWKAYIKELQYDTNMMNKKINK